MNAITDFSDNFLFDNEERYLGQILLYGLASHKLCPRLEFAFISPSNTELGSLNLSDAQTLIAYPIVYLTMIAAVH